MASQERTGDGASARKDGRPASGSYSLTDKYLADEGRVFMSGLQALARLPLEQLRADRRAGLETAALVSGYPGSPLGGYDRAVAEAARLAPALPVHCRPALNEEYAASAVMGSQLAAAQPDCLYDGIVGIWYGKAPGVDRATDALRHAVYAGTSIHGGAVAIVGDDPAAKSSTLPSSSAGVLWDLHVPLLYPGDPAEALDLGRHAIALSRLTGLWSALKIVADVADATASVELHPDRFAPRLPTIDGVTYAHRPDGRLLTPHTIDLEREIFDVRYELARQYASENRLNHIATNPREAWIGIVASGITYREVREALARLGLPSEAEIEACGIRLLKMAMPLPFNPATLQDFARDLPELLVVEEKQPNIESLIKDSLYALSPRPRIVGKHDERGERLFAAHGALDADAIAPILRRRLEPRLGDRLAPARTVPDAPPAPLRVQRSPFFCSGCPHNRSTEVPEGVLVGAGIGCHTMTLLMDPERVGDIAGIACMGNEGTQWIGMADFVARDHFIQNLGDGTYFHSGQLAVQAAVAAGVNITFKLLYNGAIAMTGGQEPQGQLGVPEVARILLGQGAARVVITCEDPEHYAGAALPDGVTVRGREELIEVQRELAAVAGTTVLIHDQACAAETRRLRKRGLAATPRERVVINHRICEGCGDCGRVSNCLSVQPIETPFGRKTEIDQTTCNLDYSCLEGDCPSFMTVTLPRSGAVRETSSGERISSAPSDLPAPHPIVSEDDFAMRITGIGGTGVVTVAQVLGTAAMLDGYHVRGLDQIGLSQKAGPVVSDLRLSRSAPTATNRLGGAQADLLLACDQLVAASPLGLHTAHPDHTAVVGSTSATPTGEMITHPDLPYPADSDLCKQIAAASRSGAQFWADADAITSDLLRRATTANVFVVGMALQAGCLPIDPESIERAIALNGVAVDANLEAFRWGRAQVARPECVAEARSRMHETARLDEPALPDDLARRIAAIAAPADLDRALRRHASELIAWQGPRVAGGWLDVVERVARAERAVAPESTRLLAAAAANLYKLTAYKDEYEVARLMTDRNGLAAARELAGRHGRIAWKLHPPLLRALGMRRKLTFGRWATPLLRMLARGRFLRGTFFDPFGHTDVRRLERELAAEFASALDVAIAALRDDTLADAVALAELPDAVRGYEALKLRRIAEYRERLASALAAFPASG